METPDKRPRPDESIMVFPQGLENPAGFPLFPQADAYLSTTKSVTDVLAQVVNHVMALDTSGGDRGARNIMPGDRGLRPHSRFQNS